MKSITEVIFLLDRSGSMEGLERDTIGGFNGFVENQNQLEGETFVTAVLFDDKYEVLWNGEPSENVRLSEKEYYVRGTTALLDAVGKTILEVRHRLSESSEGLQPRNVIVVITTDGMENSSHEFTYEKVNSMIKHQKEKYNWDFIFLGANIDVAKEANQIGIDINDAFHFEASSNGVSEMYDVIYEEVAKKRNNF